jgi:hypothetical protein
MKTTEEVIEERSKTHGNYSDVAAFAQAVMRAVEATPNWPLLSDVHRDGIHMIMHKVSRALNGDPMEPDHFDDIAGYAKLVANWIRVYRSPVIQEQAPEIGRLVLRGTAAVGTCDDHGPATP